MLAHVKSRSGSVDCLSLRTAAPRLRQLAMAALTMSLGLAQADEGMWTLDNAPVQRIQESYGANLDPAWLSKAMHASARLAFGCSASFVSGEGLILTNHHCAARCVEQLSSAEHNLLEEGFVAATRSEERQCPAMEVNRLEQISDITADIASATANLEGDAYKQARNAAEARITSDCAGADPKGTRCDIVDLYHGGQYKLYRYHRFQDVRLVFAPEKSVAFFGGDPDNFNFPRFDLDMAMVRVYENGVPAATPEHFAVNPQGPKAGELVFVTGHPGSTQREYTAAKLATQREFVLPRVLLKLSEYRGVLEQYRSGGSEQARYATEELFSVENSLKALRGRFEALLDPTLTQKKVDEETVLRDYANSHGDWKAKTAGAWEAIDKAQKTYRNLYPLLMGLEGGNPFLTDYFRFARTLVRGAAERPLPNGKRLPEFADAALPEVEARLLSPAPVHPDFEALRFGFALDKLRESLGPDNAIVKQILGNESPQQLAQRVIAGSRLNDPDERKRLWAGGKAAVDASDDPMILFMKTVDVPAREVRKRYESEVESVEQKNAERIARVRFARSGTDIYPDATFSLRLSYGTVQGWQEGGVKVDPFTTLGGIYTRATGSAPFALPPSWLEARDRLNPATPFNLSTTNDIIGGNSGSPMINVKGELVGLVFDGNIHSLGGAYWYDARDNRAVAVDSAAILEALDKVYHAGAIAQEMLGN